MNERYTRRIRRARSSIAVMFHLLKAMLDPRLDLDAKDRALMAAIDRRNELAWKRVQRRNNHGL